MFITLLVLLVFAVAITVGIMSLKDMAQDSVKFKDRVEMIEAFSSISCLILFILIICLWWKMPNGSMKATEPPIMKAPAVETPLADKPPLASVPTATVIVPTPTAVPEEEAASEFGGVLIKNSSGQWFSIRMWDEDKNMYVPYKMTNDLGEEVTKNKDPEYFLEAADAETYFEGYVLVGAEEKDENKHDFSFDSKKTKGLIKRLGI